MEPFAVGELMPMIVAYAGHLAGGMIDTAVSDRLRQLWDTVSTRFRGDEVAEAALDRLRERPEDPHRRSAVHGHLQDVVDSDPEFARTLAELARAVEAAGGAVPGRVPAMVVKDSGAMATGQAHLELRGIVVSGRDTHVRRVVERPEHDERPGQPDPEGG
ncbi:hypothetical protein ACIRD2_08355 [Streptomyces sp. NPDC093595]|uniref:hypothetical protein n=1 Tax=Streptomyces sp. NPDC093595 TaxID=3366045 RepID=UPI00381A78A0